MTVSVCTIARGRETQLRNLVLGLSQQSALPDELVIARMQPEPYTNLPPCPFPVRQVAVEGARLPLARARNAAAENTIGDALIFLDVDCIPLPGLVENYTVAMSANRCLMGETRYLSQADPPEVLSFEAMWQCADQHPARRYGSESIRLPETTEFWSLSFAMMRETFWKVGGFDALFDGYGGEDTDFAMSLADSAVELFWLPKARAVHQWHPVQIPAFNHFDDIVRNANRFYKKRGQWCMDYWLDQFEAAGLICKSSDQIEVLRQPSADERQAAVRDGSVRFS